MTVYTKSACYIRISFAIKQHVSQPSPYFLDTGAQPNLVTKQNITNHWLSFVENKRSKPLTSAIKTILTLRQPKHYDTIEDLQFRSRFLVDNNLKVYILVGTGNINQHILEILPNVLDVISRSSLSIFILSLHLKTVKKIVTIDDSDTIQVKESETDVKVVKQIQLELRIVTPLLLSPIQPIQGLSRFDLNMTIVQRQLLPTNGIM